ncbi:MAG TPA: hypothetical protein VHE14_00050 [Solirubrobacteraceae bacterium]|nr:hypothetical protein [Solirubrobacteraceae bacterium]
MASGRSTGRDTAVRAGKAAAQLGVKAARRDAYWPAQLAALAAVLLYFALPDKIIVGPRWVVPSLEAILLLGLVVTTPSAKRPYFPGRRRAAIGLIALVTAANLVSLALLVHYLLRGGKAGGHELILAGTEIWLTNMLIFSLWFWEFDRGGPHARSQPDPPPPDLLFQQMVVPEYSPLNWQPTFVDYFYTSLTNVTAFSPTDTMPLSPWAKILMGVESMIALVTIGLVAARAVNILG